MTKAAAKKIENNTELVSEIINLTDTVNDLSIKLKSSKATLTTKTKELSEASLKIFNTDIGDFTDDRAPDIYGNHEYQCGSRLINVNFKTKSGGFTLHEISGHKACDLLPKMLGDKDYKKLFKETPNIKDDESKLNKVFLSRPDLIGQRLNSSALPPDAMKDLIRKYPNAFTPYIIDSAAYIAEVDGVEVTTEVTTASGFIGKVEKLPEEPRQKMRNLFRKIFNEVVTVAVKCGNKASA